MLRTKIVDVNPGLSREEQLSEAIDEAAQAIPTLDWLGGNVVITPIREPTEREHIYRTIGFVFTYDSRPTVRPKAPAPEEEVADVEANPAEEPEEAA